MHTRVNIRQRASGTLRRVKELFACLEGVGGFERAYPSMRRNSSHMPLKNRPLVSYRKKRSFGHFGAQEWARQKHQKATPTRKTHGFRAISFFKVKCFRNIKTSSREQAVFSGCPKRLLLLNTKHGPRITPLKWPKKAPNNTNMGSDIASWLPFAFEAPANDVNF